ncbi:MAG TPA: hypothetical protein VJ947_05395, partial [Pseudohaliea sp.]|nr:hypothetical protein [Pseudohaliea sp.]
MRAPAVQGWFAGTLAAAAIALAAVVRAAPAPLPTAAGLVDAYLGAWVAFYPSQAYAFGDVASAARFEAYGEDRLAAWLALNVRTRDQLTARLAEDALEPARRTDLQVLLGQVEDELARWTEDDPLRRQPQWYAEQASQALTHLLVRAAPAGQARSDAAVRRLRGVQAL